MEQTINRYKADLKEGFLYIRHSILPNIIGVQC